MTTTDGSTTDATTTEDRNDVNTLSTEAANFSWLLGNFVKSVPGVQHTLVVSADGLLMAMSDELDRTQGDQLSAIVSGLSSLTRGAARQLRAGEVRQSIVEMDRLFLFTTSISDGSVLAVAAEATCDVGLVGYEMTLLVTRAEATMTPALVSEMRSRLPVAGVLRPVGVEG
jgi:predicted regulator of Ras-like GTPase activity (Roadblock/LC7/MglB family)